MNRALINIDWDSSMENFGNMAFSKALNNVDKHWYSEIPELIIELTFHSSYVDTLNNTNMPKKILLPKYMPTKKCRQKMTRRQRGVASNSTAVTTNCV